MDHLNIENYWIHDYCLQNSEHDDIKRKLDLNKPEDQEIFIACYLWPLVVEYCKSQEIWEKSQDHDECLYHAQPTGLYSRDAHLVRHLVGRAVARTSEKGSVNPVNEILRKTHEYTNSFGRMGVAILAKPLLKLQDWNGNRGQEFWDDFVYKNQKELESKHNTERRNEIENIKPEPPQKKSTPERRKFTREELDRDYEEKKIRDEKAQEKSYKRAMEEKKKKEEEEKKQRAINEPARRAAAIARNKEEDRNESHKARKSIRQERDMRAGAAGEAEAKSKSIHQKWGVFWQSI